ncbi:AAA family ATPase [Patescibacteria group bacterium]|nr:AAA family ATPase [Patescibacteria group bacterium]
MQTNKKTKSTATQLPAQILNYFATFTETRFNFRRLINYHWTDNEYTLDLSLFPDFEKALLEQIKAGEKEEIAITPGIHTITLKKEDLVAEMRNVLESSCSADKLTEYIEEELSILTKQTLQTGDIEDLKKKAWQEGSRKFNLQLRKELEATVIRLQEKILAQHKEETGSNSFPPTSFGMANYLKTHFDALQSLTMATQAPGQYQIKVAEYFKGQLSDIILYDLFFNLQSYAAFAPMGTLYLFFHVIGKETNKFPLYFVEVEMRLSSTEITFSFPRDLLLLNVPAVNFFKFEKVLTIPRASSFGSAQGNLSAMEVFIQSQYGHHQPFVLEPNFREIIHDNKDLPSITGRIGFQIVGNEDKKLLDYSEIMTHLEQGGHNRFTEFVKEYIEGTVPNHQDEVDQTFLERYPLTSPQRYISNGPIPLNKSQKQILLALANAKNKMIVIDGPPGTGKSHTIAALAYQANEEGKSVVITSHKKEALDVIDRMMTDKYKSLHPQAKPSITRMDQESGSENNINNSLQNAVVSAASSRALEFNAAAVSEDATKVAKKLDDELSDRISNAEHTADRFQNLIAFNILNDSLNKDEQIAQLINKIPAIREHCRIDALQKLFTEADWSNLSTTSLEEYEFIVARKGEIQKFLDACEHINPIPTDTLSIETDMNAISPDLQSLIERLTRVFRGEAKVATLTPKNASGGLFLKLTGKAASEKDINTIIKECHSLQYNNSLKEIIRLSGKTKESATIDDLRIGLKQAEVTIALREYKSWIDEYWKLDGNNGMTIPDMFAEVSRYKDHLELFSETTLSSLKTLFAHYGEILSLVGIEKRYLSTLSRLTTGEAKEKSIFDWIKLHIKLSKMKEVDSDFAHDAAEYARLKQKELEHKNDLRLKELNQHLGVMQQIRVSYNGGKRFTREQTDVLLKTISVIIAEPAILSKYFPMEEELIDILIIDEASQVSIADSISLILRAKQVVIFGDEYQYGAVSAQNVSTRYSASYFSEIVNAYADDYKIAVSEQARAEVVREVAKDVKDEDMESDALLRPQDNPGAVLWLKTFNIRTSTLTFAKAIANYTTSLREHFRSFPEIISYSNEFFYKPAQQELIINRIRTKPIGETLQFLRVHSKGKAGQNTNLDEIDTIVTDIEQRIQNGFKGSIGIITSLKEQQARLEEALNERTNLPLLRKNHKLAVWFVGDVQGEERDIVYYSLVEDQNIQNADLRSIYPVIGGTADSIRSLKMQRLNVGFSRAKDTMIFVHSQDIEKFSTTRLGDALKHYRRVLEEAEKNDFFIADESIFDSPKEKELYQLLLNTEFVKIHKANLRIVPQFPIGKYLRAEFAAQIPDYRTDFLLVLSENGKEKTLILEYDGLEFHFKDPSEVSRYSMSREFIDYDISRQLELESYGYSFLRINKFTLRPEKDGDTPISVLNRLLISKFI